MGSWQYYNGNPLDYYWGGHRLYHGVCPSHPNFGRQWWSKQWVQALETDLPQNINTLNRKYARKGIILEAYIATCEVYSFSETKGYYSDESQKITFTIFKNETWDAIFADIQSKPYISELLLKNILDPELEQIFQATGEHLIPPSITSVYMECTCRHMNMEGCRHMGPLWLLIADELDHNPLLIFELYGMMPIEVLARLNTDPARQDYCNTIISNGNLVRKILQEQMQTFMNAKRKQAFDAFDDYILDQLFEEDMGINIPVIPEELVEAEHAPVDPQSFWHCQHTPIAMPLMPLIEQAQIINELGPIPFWHGDISLHDAVKDLYPVVSHQATALLEGRFPFNDDEIGIINSFLRY